MPEIVEIHGELTVPDADVEFKEPETAQSGFHSIAISPPQLTPQPSLFIFGGKLAEPVESVTTPPARSLSRDSILSKDI